MTFAPGGGWGLTENYPVDSDKQGSRNTTDLDNLSVTDP
jgi:hypothetical protein